MRLCQKTYDEVTSSQRFYIATTKDFGESLIWSDEECDEYLFESGSDLNREDPLLIKVVEMLGDKANGRHAKLKIVEIPDGVEYEIDEYDGIESVHEIHRVWS